MREITNTVDDYKSVIDLVTSNIHPSSFWKTLVIQISKRHPRLVLEEAENLKYKEGHACAYWSVDGGES